MQTSPSKFCYFDRRGFEPVPLFTVLLGSYGVFSGGYLIRLSTVSLRLDTSHLSFTCSVAYTIS